MVMLVSAIPQILGAAKAGIDIFNATSGWLGDVFGPSYNEGWGNVDFMGPPDSIAGSGGRDYTVSSGMDRAGTDAIFQDAYGFGDAFSGGPELLGGPAYDPLAPGPGGYNEMDLYPGYTPTEMYPSDAVLVAGGEPIAGSGVSDSSSGVVEYGTPFDPRGTLNSGGEAGGYINGAGNFAGIPGANNDGMTAGPPPTPVTPYEGTIPTTTAGEDPRTTNVGGGVGNPNATGSGGWNGPAQQYTVGRTYTAAPAGYRPGFSPEHQYIRYSIAPVGDPVIAGIGGGYTDVPEAPPPLVPPLPPYTGPAMIDPETAFMPPGYARGGPVQGEGGIARLGPRQTKGPGDGMSDSIPATIDGRQRAVLSKDEFVFPADVVSDLGNGSSDAGAQILYAMVDRIRQARHGTTEQPPEIDPEAFLPA